MAKVLSLRDHRKNKGLSRKRVAELSRVPYTSYLRIEKNVSAASIDRLQSICVVLGITLDEIFFEE